MIERSSKFLMANLGAEVERILHWKEKKDSKMLASASGRAKIIIAQIMDCPDMQARAQEIKILNDVISDLSSDVPNYHILPSHLQSYFSPFVRMAAIH